MLTPLLAKLRMRHPGAHVVMALARACAPLYGARPYGVEAIGWDPRVHQSLHGLFSCGGFDLAYVPGDNRHSWLALAAGARWIVAFAGDRPPYKSWPVDELRPYSDAPATWGDMVAQLVDGPSPAPYAPGDWAAPECREFIPPSAPYAVLHVGASSALKQWEAGKWRALAQTLTARGLTVVWSAGRNEAQLVDACDPERRYRSFAGALDLPQLWHLLARARLLACPDTGVAHLGRIVNVPTVALFGPGSATICGGGEFWRHAPYRAVTVDPFPCRDQRVLFKREIAWVRRCARSTAECAQPRCLQAIDVARVEAAISELVELK